MNKNFITLATATLGIYSLSSCGKQEAEKAPNILFCVADDISFPHASAYGTKWVSTPGFDRVAREGILFQRMYTCNAKSAPSRSCMITGRNSWQLEAAANHWPDFPAKFKSYPEALAQQGYYTGATGKGWGPGQALDSAGMKRDIVGKMLNGIKLKPPTSGISNVDYAANFREFLKNKPEGKPFCFWYGASEPHRGYEYASSIRAGKSISDIDSVPSFWPDNETVRTDMLDYALEIEHFDRHLVAILQALEEAGELDNTLVIVTADHGMPFPRCKGQEYEYSNHIPFAVMWRKGIANPGRISSELLSVIDLAPTFLEVAGLSPEQSGMAPITGKSFTDILYDKSDGHHRQRVLIGKERHDVGRPDDAGYPIRGIIRGDYLYLMNFETSRWPAGNPETGYLNIDGSPTKTEVIRSRRNPATAALWNLSMGKRSSEELYNIAADKDCTSNLVDMPDFLQLKQEMQTELLSLLAEQADPRMDGKGAIFDNYPYMGAERMVWNRMKEGEKIKLGFVNESDYEPGASGLPVEW
ncbi:MAG: sulfatase [Tannerellaceae bacterium]|jgi:arylsulfatase A-like enzyme|nr:sulfatase [Tannerellaceae bacterium]